MLRATSGEPITLPVELTLGGEFVVPDAGSLSMTLRAGDGTILKQEDLPDTSLSTVQIAIDASYNTLADGDDLALRFLRLDWTVASKPAMTLVSYQVTPSVFFAFGPREIRALLGATVEEFPDDSFAVYQAYLNLKASFPDLTGYLQAPDLTALAAHKAVALQAALDTAPSWPMRFMTTETEENATLTRSKIDFPLLERSLRAQLQTQTATMTGTTGVTTTLPALMAVSSPTDPITNT